MKQTKQQHLLSAHVQTKTNVIKYSNAINYTQKVAGLKLVLTLKFTLHFLL